METKSRQLALRVRSAEGSARDDLEAQLLAHLHEIFTLKQEMRASEIESLQERINLATVERNERDEIRETVVSRRLNELLGRSSKYDW